MQTCPHCGFRNTDGRTICEECHQSLPAANVISAATQPKLPTTPSAAAPTVTIEPGIPPRTALWIKIGCGIGAFVVGCCILLIVIGSLNPPAPTTGEPTTNPTSVEIDPTLAAGLSPRQRRW